MWSVRPFLSPADWGQPSRDSSGVNEPAGGVLAGAGKACSSPDRICSDCSGKLVFSRRLSIVNHAASQGWTGHFSTLEEALIRYSHR